MTHHLTALIGERLLLERLAGEQWVRRVLNVNASLALLPLPEETSDTPIRLEPQQGEAFQYLGPKLLDRLSEASQGARLAYIETDYWGGDGGQGAVVFCDAKLEYGPEWSRIGPINKALRLMGVKIGHPAIDEFATVGLGDRRTTEDWLAREPQRG